jgi:hypothetical protein
MPKSSRLRMVGPECICSAILLNNAGASLVPDSAHHCSR